MFRFNIKEEHEKTIVHLDGDLDIEATEVIEGELMNDLKNTSGFVELDFKNIDFVDSSGIGLLITLISFLKDSNRKPTITNINEDVKVVFELLQLDEILGQNVVVV
ncbi:anti-sigma factor antagonist [Lysinibacillus sp. PLM2]|nr:anti-sigma factor antagonist [Lysinibacillus sp. PLM2]